MTDGVAQQTARSYGSSRVREAATIRLNPKLRWQITQVVADLITVFVTAMATYGFYLASGIGRGHYDPGVYLRLNLAFAVVLVFALHGYGAYREQQGLLRIEAVRQILRATFAGVLLTLGVSFLIKFPFVSRFTVVLLGPATVLALFAQRILMWKLRDRAREKAGDTTRVLIYGAGDTGRLLAQHLLDEHHLGLTPVGFLDDRQPLYGEDVKVGPGVNGKHLMVHGGEDRLREIVTTHDAEAVIIAMPSAPVERTNELISRIEALNIPFFFVPSAGDILISSLRLGRVAGIPVFTRRSADAPRAYLMTKRLIDVLGALLALFVTSPVLLVGAVAVRFSSPGPVFFRQMRVGLNGKPFTIYKLRTMSQEAPQYALHPDSSEDPRITRVGQCLRRLSIDELPQLFNVLKGDMSLVGPRPEMQFVVDKYDDTQRQRLTVMPGVTGLWQISADRAFKIHDNIQYDLYYAENRSVSLDLAILLSTPVVLLAKNRTM
jgi:exopolysaccharide biosynthesis polyprenyl glycosylphosphotransferase